MAQAPAQIKEIERIVDQLQRACNGEAWHGPSLMESLQGVDAQTAAAKPLANAHSIWEIVNHVSAWEDAIRHRLAGEVKQLEGPADWPPVADTSEAAWKITLDTFKRNHSDLVKAISTMPEHRLLAIVPGKKYDFYHLLHGAVQHELYHAGQIALLKKARK